LIGAATTGGLGSRHDPALAARALEENRDQIERVIDKYSVVIVIGTGGKGTGAGTMFPLADLVRRQSKLVLPVFVRPSFERHEVDKGRYDHALDVAARFDSERIRLIEILNDRAYDDRDPQPQSVVWERMNLPIARGLRGLIYVLWDLSQVDPSDLSILLAGDGRMRIGFGEIDPPDGADPADAQIREAVDRCWQNPYCTFSRPAGTSLVCIQGDWSNVADGKIKRQLGTWAALGAGAPAAGNAADSVYNPLYARPSHVPRPWGVTALFAEHTGIHDPLDVDWPLDRRVSLPLPVQAIAQERVAVAAETRVAAARTGPIAVVVAVEPAPSPASFPTFRDLCLGINRREAAALAIAQNGASSEIALNCAEVRKLIGTVWFRSVFAQLSQDWRERILDTLLQSSPLPDHTVRIGRHQLQASETSYEDLRRVVMETVLPDAVRADLQLLVAVGTLWGADTIERFEFAPPAPRESSSKLFSLAAFNPEP